MLTAEDGADAVGIYAQHKKDIALVLTDMMMPIMAGAAEIHALRRMNPRVKIIAASGLTAGGLGMGDAPLGTDFLLKPYSAETLLRAIRANLDEETTKSV